MRGSVVLSLNWELRSLKRPSLSSSLPALARPIEPGLSRRVISARPKILANSIRTRDLMRSPPRTDWLNADDLLQMQISGSQAPCDGPGGSEGKPAQCRARRRKRVLKNQLAVAPEAPLRLLITPGADATRLSAHVC